MTVMHTGGPSHHDNRPGREYRSPQAKYEDTTKSVRAITGLFSMGAIGLFTFFALQVVSVVLAGLGTFGMVVLIAITGAILIVVAVKLFDLLQERRVSILLAFFVVYGLSFFIPGLPVLLALVCVGASGVLTLYLLATLVVRSRWVAAAVAAIPLIGGMYYVPASVSTAGLVTRFISAGTSANTPISNELSELYATVSGSSDNAAVVSYQIRNNRLYADICADGRVDTIELDTAEITATKVRWLERKLPREIDALVTRGRGSGSVPGYARVARLLSPALNRLRGFDCVLVADGALLDVPHQALLHSCEVFRSVELRGANIRLNLANWHNQPHVTPDQVAIINALPQSLSELQRLELSSDEWEQWSGWHARFAEALPQELRQAKINRTPNKQQTLEAIQGKQCVVMVIAHCDGYSIRLPNGESIEVKDLESVRDKIEANRPKVFLFSCEAARTSNVRSFAKALLDCGAEAVVAPVERLSVTEAMDVFRSFLNHAFGDTPLPLNQAFRRTLEETKRTTMEIWLGQNESEELGVLAAKRGNEVDRSMEGSVA